MTLTMPTDRPESEAKGRGEITLGQTLGAMSRYGLSVQEVRLFVRLYPGLPVSREALLEAMWGPGGYRDTRAVDMAISRLRGKLAEDWEIERVPGGYRLISRHNVVTKA